MTFISHIPAEIAIAIGSTPTFLTNCSIRANTTESYAYSKRFMGNRSGYFKHVLSRYRCRNRPRPFQRHTLTENGKRNWNSYQLTCLALRRLYDFEASRGLHMSTSPKWKCCTTLNRQLGTILLRLHLSVKTICKLNANEMQRSIPIRSTVNLNVRENEDVIETEKKSMWHKQILLATQESVVIAQPQYGTQP